MHPEQEAQDKADYEALMSALDAAAGAAVPGALSDAVDAVCKFISRHPEAQLVPTLQGILAELRTALDAKSHRKRSEHAKRAQDRAYIRVQKILAEIRESHSG